MPNYEFKCVECNRKVEKHFKFEERHDVDCAICDARMVKVIHAAPAILKGSGWAKNG